LRGNTSYDVQIVTIGLAVEADERDPKNRGKRKKRSPKKPNM